MHIRNEEIKSHTYVIRKQYAPGEDRTLDLQIALYVIMRLTRCLLRYRGTYVLKHIIISNTRTQFEYDLIGNHCF